MNKFAITTPPNIIEFIKTSDWVMRITADRRIEVNEDIEVNEAAQKVLDAMQHLLRPQRQPLTPGAIRNLYARHCDPVDFARAVEAAYEASAKR